MNSKKYVIGFLLLVGLFFWGNVGLWYGYTKALFVLPDGHGDLTRNAFLPKVHTLMRNYRPQKRHIEFRDYINMEDKPKVDIITLGDSFSNGAAGMYYQDYLAENYNENVLNLPMMEDGNPLTVLYRLIETGMIKEINPRMVILESIERSAVNRFGMTADNYKNISRENLIKYYTPNNKTTASGKKEIFSGVMMNVNKELLKAKYKYYGSKNQLSDLVYKAKLTNSMFTDDGREKMLLYYCDDLWYHNAEIDYSKINGNLDDLSDELNAMGIQLVVMINVDKLDLYYPYITMPTDIAENKFMETFAKQPRKYVFIDTKSILRKELARGEKDIYWQDDTHWSWKAQQKVVDVIMEKTK